LPPSPHSSSDHLIPSTLTPSDSSSSFTRFANVLSLASAGAIYGSTQSFASGFFHAQDQFLIGALARQSHGQGHTVEQLTPSGLSFFDLIILANTVHEHAPTYSLLKGSVTGLQTRTTKSFLSLMVPPSPPHPRLPMTSGLMSLTKFAFLLKIICPT
jgi:hypothetical protein